MYKGWVEEDLKSQNLKENMKIKWKLQRERWVGECVDIF